jgi:hypothetical protein
MTNSKSPTTARASVGPYRGLLVYHAFNLHLDLGRAREHRQAAGATEKQMTCPRAPRAVEVTTRSGVFPCSQERPKVSGSVLPPNDK